MVSMHKNGILQEQVVSLVRDRRGYLTRRSWKGELRWVFEIGNEPAIIQSKERNRCCIREYT